MDSAPIIFYKYDPRRSAAAAKEFLEYFKGTIVCDGLKSYDAFAALTGVILAGCMAHMRRYFYRADKMLKKTSPKSKRKTTEVLSTIKKLCDIERRCKKNELTLNEIYKLRQEESKPIMDELKIWLDNESIKVRPKSQLGKAINYVLGQWEKLNVFLTNPYVPIDNNATEAAIRPFVIGRKNWLFSNSTDGAEASAGLYSLIETAKANGLEPFSYLHTIFKELPKCLIMEDYQKLLPYNISKYFNVTPLLERSPKLSD